MMKRTISVIGSFRKHNEQIQQVCEKLRGAGMSVASPQGNQVIDKDVEFVRFDSDSATSSDAAIQLLALHRILRSDLIYAVVPEGYIGKTTSYEVGRILQSSTPIYFSDRPLDLPVHIADQFVMDTDILLGHICDPQWQPKWLFADDDSREANLEKLLIERAFLHE
ncbi:hypothetical protein [Pseudomonas fluorescens]|jgi:hypothetical protein|uniref:hypothetical protein n=1 Tax=Pseudomonas fluorescens TaxID=294 RepID=UPI002005135E|nr:hypothetical protein [Pseudomonas fluorescens]MCK3831604.1 hypothetical protein [Pseudomonas fluorescens]